MAVNEEWTRMSDSDQSNRWIFLSVAGGAGALAKYTMDEEYTLIGVTASVVALVFFLAFLKGR